MTKSPVVPIPSSFSKDDNLETESTKKYLNFLFESGIECIMSTAGTSSFNLLNIEEIHHFNNVLSKSHIKHKILGIPPLSLKETIKFIDFANKNYVNDTCNLMAFYPDRWYDNDTIKSYFAALSKKLEKAIYIHCMPMRSHVKPIVDYDYQLINRLFKDKILAGIKEEHSNLSASYNFVSKLDNNIDVIVAGGSMRRHQYLKSAGANRFLAGLGNIFPKIEINYQNNKKQDLCLKQETALFDVFMNIGWHKSLREALRQQGHTCFFDRQPWPKVNNEEKNQIFNVLKQIKEGLDSVK